MGTDTGNVPLIKHQIPNLKFQINSKSQIANLKHPAVWNLVLGVWCLFVIWCLEFVIFTPETSQHLPQLLRRIFCQHNITRNQNPHRS